MSQPSSLGTGDLIQAQGSVAEVFRRLKTFRATTWFGKPPGLAARECASKGWSNTGPDTLSCSCCGAQILCKLPVNPWSESAAGIVDKYVQRLLDAHAPQCRQRRLMLAHQPPQQPTAGVAAPSSSPGFPILPVEQLFNAYNDRLRSLQHLTALPDVPTSTRTRLAAVAARLDPAVLSALAAVLQLPLQTLQQEAAAAGAPASAATAAAAGAGAIGVLSKQQAQVVAALCGWQVRQLLPQDLAQTAAAAGSQGTVFGVSHLVPTRRASTSSGTAGQHGPTPAAAAGSSSSSAAGAATQLLPAVSVLECELCGCQVGLWRLSCSGPFYAQQLSSKAVKTLAAAAAAPPPAGAGTATGTKPATAPKAAATVPAAAAETGAEAGVGEPEAAHAGSQHQDPAPTAAAAAMHDSAANGPSSGAAPAGRGGAGASSSPAPQAQPEVAGAAAARTATSTSPQVVFSTLSHTIAGGSLLAGAAAATAAGTTTAAISGAVASTTGGPFGPQQLQQQQPFGATVQPVFGSSPAAPAAAAAASSSPEPLSQQQQQHGSSIPAASATRAGSSGLFGDLSNVAAASVFGSPPPAAPAAASSGPFGAAAAGAGSWGGGGGEGQAAAAGAPVFGLQAFAVEEQRTKRMRTSVTAISRDPSPAAAAAANSTGGTAAGAAGSTDAAAGAAEAGPAGTPQHPVLTAAAAAGAAGAARATGVEAGAVGGERVLSFSKQRSGLAAAVAAEAGDVAAAAAAEGAGVFDPVSAHRSWCPWVTLPGGSDGCGSNGDGCGSNDGSNGGLVAAVRMGWSSTVLAVRELQPELQDMQQQQQQRGAGKAAGDYEDTAAALARSRQVMDMLVSKQ